MRRPKGGLEGHQGPIFFITTDTPRTCRGLTIPAERQVLAGDTPDADYHLATYRRVVRTRCLSPPSCLRSPCPPVARDQPSVGMRDRLTRVRPAVHVDAKPGHGCIRRHDQLPCLVSQQPNGQRLHHLGAMPVAEASGRLWMLPGPRGAYDGSARPVPQSDTPRPFSAVGAAFVRMAIIARRLASPPSSDASARLIDLFIAIPLRRGVRG